MAGINTILRKIADDTINTRRQELEEIKQAKQAFVPMPGGAGAAPAMDPAMMDPAMMDPAMAMAAGGGDPNMLAAVSGQAGLPEMAAAQGAPVDPAMAMAGGAPLPQDTLMQQAEGAPTPEPSAEGKEKKPSEKQRTDERLANIEGMLNTIMGALMAKGLLQPDAIPAAQGTNANTTPETAMDMVESMGEPVEPTAPTGVPKEASSAKGNMEAKARSLADTLAAAFKVARTQ